MGARIRKNGRIFCAAINKEEPGDCYLDDSVLYYLAVETKVLVTTENDTHMTTGGEWWWKGQEPKDVVIDKFYYESDSPLSCDFRDEAQGRNKCTNDKVKSNRCIPNCGVYPIKNK